MIIHDHTPPTITTDGARFSIVPHEFPYRRRTTIRVGSRSSRIPGPAGTARWVSARRNRQFYQELTASVFPHAIIRVHDNKDIHVYNATERNLELLDNTFPLVPPAHLQCVIDEKTAGFRIVSSRGRGRSLPNYMGGGNIQHDDLSTAYDERLCIQITYGALWENDARLGMCPTVLHEIGHVMTHGNNGLSIRSIDRERHDELTRLRVSQNAGQLEGLCNAYMYFLCYGSTDTAVHNYGRRSSRPETSIQKDRRTRDALRRCPAFTRLSGRWPTRFNER